MQLGRYIPDLNHDGHVISILACRTHVYLRVGAYFGCVQLYFLPPALMWPRALDVLGHRLCTRSVVADAVRMAA